MVLRQEVATGKAIRHCSRMLPNLSQSLYRPTSSAQENQASSPVVAYVSKMAAVPESELPKEKRNNGTLSPEEAREMARKKRAQIAKAQAGASGSDGVSEITNGIGSTRIGEEEEEQVT